MKSLTAAVASAVLMSSAASAAGLGRLTVLSALGQPLRAEIELTTGPGEDPGSMAVKLAAPEAFRNANIDFNPALLSLRFVVENRGGRQVIRVNSAQPLNEPFVDMLLELTWNNGRLVREYTFLLDPPELRATQPAQVAAGAATGAAAGAAASAAAGSEQSRLATRAAAARAGAERQASAAAADEESPSSYRVRRGDTLGRIANRVKPGDVSLDMMLVALYRANPDAFIGNNMNRLKSGQILSVPDADAVRSGASAGEARGVVVTHAADFEAYRNKLAGQVASSTPSAAPEAGQSATGRVTARVEENASSTKEAQDKLRLSKAEAAGAATAGAAAQQGGTASVEDTVAKQRELAAAQARVKELEKNVGELESLMTVENRQGAEAQQGAAAGAAGAAAGAATGAATETPAEPAAEKPAPRPRLKKPAPPPEEPGLVDTLMDNIAVLGAGAAVLLLGAFGIAQRRKRKDEPAKATPTEPSVLGVPGAAHSLFAESGGQSVDTNNSVFNSSFAPSASQLDTNEVDPVAEADVYIAYGRDAQAEEILKEALRIHPERHPVRLKLLEIYAARKDLRAFETQARELHALTAGQGDEWAQAAAQGLTIDPANPLYANAAPAPVAAPSAQERSQQAMLSQQFEESFRSGAPVAAAAAAGAAAGAGAVALAKDEQPTAVPAAAPAAAPQEQDSALDFDLNGLTFEPVSADEPAAAGARPDPNATAVPDLEFNTNPVTQLAPQAKPAPDVNDLDFDMTFDAPNPAPAPAPAAKDDDFALDLSPQAQVQATPVDMAGLAKDFDGLPPLPAAAPAPAASTLDADPLFDLDTMDFGTTEAAPVPAAGKAPAVGTADDPLFDLDAMDFGTPDDGKSAPVQNFGTTQAVAQDDPFDAFDLPETPAAVPAAQESQAAANPFDNAGFDLDLPEEPAAPAQADSPFAAPVDAEPGQMSPEHMEMETKLDLAIAYQEIGDKEGARELLDEVIKGGNAEQVSKASSMRDLLA